jgi:hypothetical protein
MDQQDIFFAALLHDIGKIGFPDTLLSRPVSRMSGEDLAQYRKHPATGAAALMPLDELKHAAQIVRARCSPSRPVPALALPVLTTSARIGCAPARNSRHRRTGAAQKRFRVNTPAARLPSARAITKTSLRPGVLTPAEAIPSVTPGTAWS